jgi:DNA-binding NarL/FixJ family response regulator
MDGAALIVALQKINPQARIIASSGLTSNYNLNQVSGLGIKRVLPKPYSASALLEAVNHSLKDN